VIGPDNVPPYRLSRDDIEKAIDDHGFQLWRKRPETKAG